MQARPARPDDAGVIVQLAQDAADSMPERRGGPGLLERWLGGASTDQGLGAAIAHLRTYQRMIFVIDDAAGVVAGVGIAWVAEHAGWFAVWIDPKARHQGLGPSTAEACLRWLRDQGCQTIDSLALPGDREMKNLLEKAGFKARLLTLRRSE